MQFLCNSRRNNKLQCHNRVWLNNITQQASISNIIANKPCFFVSITLQHIDKHWSVRLTDTCTKRISCTIVSKITSNGAVIDIRNVRGFMIAQHVANTSKQAHAQRFHYTNHSRNFFERFITIGSRSYHFKIAWPARPPGTSLSTSQILNTRTIAHVLPFEGITTFDSDI